MFRNILTNLWHLVRSTCEQSKCLVELVPGDSLCSASISQLVGLITSKRESIPDTGKTPRIREGKTTPVPTRIGECNQVAR
jgi:hypothetical protein